MSCDCITRLEDLLTEKMKEKYPNGEVIDEVKFENKTFICQDNRMFLILNNPVLGRIQVGKVTRKFTTEILPKFCPFCGKSLYDESKEEGGNQ